ncbi:Adaptive-response sensory-kinase SasA [Streptomyces californicus]
MTGLVEDLLLLARLDAGRPLSYGSTDLLPLVVDAVSDARAADRPGPRPHDGPAADRTGTGPGSQPYDGPKAAADRPATGSGTGPATGSGVARHRWRLELPAEPVTVRADPARLQQVLVNLLANARTHTPPGTTVTVSVRPPARAGGPVALEVRDDGPGIPAALLPHVFERFARGDASRNARLRRRRSDRVHRARPRHRAGRRHRARRAGTGGVRAAPHGLRGRASGGRRAGRGAGLGTRHRAGRGTRHRARHRAGCRPGHRARRGLTGRGQAHHTGVTGRLANVGA